MKKVLCSLLSVLLILSLTACGKPAAIKTAEELIDAIGEVTLESSDALALAEQACSTLTDEELDQVENLQALKAARLLFDDAMADHVEELIDALSPVTAESADAVAEAEAALASLSDDAREDVKNAEDLAAARRTLDALKVAEIETTYVSLRGKINEAHSAYFSLEDGRTVTVTGDLVKARMTPDRQHIVALEQDGTLFCVETAAPDVRIPISDTILSIEAIHSTGVLYLTGSQELHRYLFADGSDLCFGKNPDFDKALNTLTVLHTDGAGGLFLTTEADSEPRLIATSQSPVTELLDVTDDGGMALWLESQDTRDEQTFRAYLWEDGETSLLTEVVGTYDGIYTDHNRYDNTLYVYSTISRDAVWKTRGKEPVRFSLPTESSWSLVYTPRGILRDDSSDLEDGLYCFADPAEGKGKDLYHVSPAGAVTQVLTNVEQMEIAFGRICYLTEQFELHTAELDGPALQNDIRIADYSRLFHLSKDGSTLYYVTGLDENVVGSLYAWEAAAGKSVLISDKCQNTLLFTDLYMKDFYPSADGKTVCFFQDVEKDVAGYTDKGTLMQCTVGQEPQVLAENLTMTAPGDGTADDALNFDSFVVEEFVKPVDEDNCFVNLLHYNGHEFTVAAENLYYDYSVKTVVEENPDDYLDAAPATVLHDGDTVTIDGVCEFTVLKSEFLEHITSGGMEYYNGAKGKNSIWATIQVEYKNLAAEEVKNRDILDKGKLTLADTYKYESSGSTSFDTLTPLSTNLVYIYFVVPENLPDEPGSVIAEFTIGGQDFTYTMREQ